MKTVPLDLLIYFSIVDFSQPYEKHTVPTSHYYIIGDQSGHLTHWHSSKSCKDYEVKYALPAQYCAMAKPA